MNKIILIIASTFLSMPAHAFTHEDLVHLSAHSGTSFALQTVFYGVNSKWLGINKPSSEVLAMAETLAIGFLYKQSESASPNQTRTSMEENLVGVAGAIGTHIVFQF